MITLKDLEEAIAECQGQKNPNANTCMKLASFYTIRNELKNVPRETAESGQVGYSSRAELMWNGHTLEELIPLLDELLEALEVLDPRLYNSFIDKL